MPVSSNSKLLPANSFSFEESEICLMADLHRAIKVISMVQWETTLTISDSTGESVFLVKRKYPR